MCPMLLLFQAAHRRAIEVSQYEVDGEAVYVLTDLFLLVLKPARDHIL